MGGSLDAFKVYLDLFKVKEEPDAARKCTFWGAYERDAEEEQAAQSKVDVKDGKSRDEGKDSGYASEENQVTKK